MKAPTSPQITTIKMSNGFAIKSCGTGHNHRIAYYVARWSKAHDRYVSLMSGDFESIGTDLNAVLKKAQEHIPELSNQTVLSIWRS